VSTAVVLLGDQAATLAPGLAELGVATAPSLESADAERVFVVGVGGTARDALLHGTRDGVTGVVGIDGAPPVDEARAGSFRAPVLAVVAERDEGEAYAFAKALTNHGVLNETVVYDDVDRGFLGTHEHATADVWKLLRRFIGVPHPA
jgi:Dienelactone hydrolase family